MLHYLRNEQYLATAQRLRSYGVFSESVIEKVAVSAAAQSVYRTYQEFFADMGVGEPLLYVSPRGAGVTVVDVPARTRKQAAVLVVHGPMGTPLDESQRYLIATLAINYPECRIIGFGNPSGDRFYYKEQSLTFWQRLTMLLTSNRRALVAAEMDYLQQQGIEKSYHVGFSYGALKSAIEVQYLPQGSVEGLIVIDPVAKPRSILRLIRDFKKTYGPLGKYVNQVGLETYHQARGEAARDRNHNRALLRPINITIAFLLSRIDIIDQLQRTLRQQPHASLTVAWGTVSELGDDVRTKEGLAVLMAAQAIRLEGLEHALANDVHLYVAIVDQSIGGAI